MEYFYWSTIALLISCLLWIAVFSARKFTQWLWAKLTGWPGSWFYYHVLPHVSRPFHWVYFVASINFLVTFVYLIFTDK